MNQLYVTLEGQRVNDNGVPVDGFVAALEGVQDAMRLMVEHLAGQKRRPGRPPRWMREESMLRVVGTRRGSLVTELELDSPSGERGNSGGYGEQAFRALQRWDGEEDSGLPREVTDRLFAIPNKLPSDVRLWLGNEDSLRRVEVRRLIRTRNRTAASEETRLYGWLKAVNWDKRRAQLHRYSESFVQLRFKSGLDEEMKRLATQYVEVRGRGKFNEKDQWQYVSVEQINDAGGWGESFELEEFRSSAKPKVFRSAEVLRASQPFDVDAFNRMIREGRNV